jgi:hypothetical protein
MIIVTLKLESKSCGSRAWTNGAQVPRSTLKKKSNTIFWNKIYKKYLDVDNVILCQCVNLSSKYLIYGSIKIMGKLISKILNNSKFQTSQICCVTPEYKVFFYSDGCNTSDKLAAFINIAGK